MGRLLIESLREALTRARRGAANARDASQRLSNKSTPYAADMLAVAVAHEAAAAVYERHLERAMAQSPEVQ